MNLTYRFDIPLNEKLCSLCKVSNNLYNQAMYEFRQVLDREKRWLSYGELDRMMKEKKNLDGDIDYRLLKAQ